MSAGIILTIVGCGLVIALLVMKSRKAKKDKAN
jgi:hypothetical protein